MKIADKTKHRWMCRVCCIAIIFSCTTTRTEIPGLPGHYQDEREPLISFGPIKKNAKRLSASYPPDGLIDGLKKYRLRYNAWPRTLQDLFYISPDAQNAVSNMLSTNFSNIEMNWLTPDSLEMYYKYNTVSKEDQQKSSGILVNNKAFKRKYIFVYNTRDRAVFVENINIK